MAADQALCLPAPSVSYNKSTLTPRHHLIITCCRTLPAFQSSQCQTPSKNGRTNKTPRIRFAASVSPSVSHESTGRRRRSRWTLLPCVFVRLSVRSFQTSSKRRADGRAPTVRPSLRWSLTLTRAFPVATSQLCNTLPQNVTSAPSLTVLEEMATTDDSSAYKHLLLRRLYI